MFKGQKEVKVALGSLNSQDALQQRGKGHYFVFIIHHGVNKLLLGGGDLGAPGFSSFAQWQYHSP